MSHDASLNTDMTTGRPAPVIPDHFLVRRIGKGAYGVVCLARNTVGAPRAVKIVYKDPENKLYSREYSGIKKFEPFSREHEGFVDILQVGCDPNGGFFYYVMELAEDRSGEAVPEAEDENSALPNYSPRTLASELETRGAFEWEECIRITTALCEALEFLHSKGLIHRDIKPANVVFVNGKPKLADVGLVADSGAASVVGTPGYVAPEGPGKAQGDIYSLGKILYQMASGKEEAGFPGLPTRLQPSLDRFLELNEVCLKACETNPSKRYQSAAEMRADLKELEAGRSLVMKRRLRKRAAAIQKLAVALLLIAGLGGLYLYSLEAIETKPLAEDALLVGVIKDSISEAGVSGALITDEKGKCIGQSFSNGVFTLRPGFAPKSFRISKEGYASFDTGRITPQEGTGGILEFRLNKIHYGFGDVVATAPHGDFPVRALAFWQGELQAMGSLNDMETVVLPVDTRQMKIMSTGWTAPISHLFGFTCWEDRFVAARSNHGELWDILPGSGTLVHTFRSNRVASPDIHCLRGLAFDGEYLWIVESDMERHRHNLHAFDLESRQAVKSVESTDPWIMALAWDGARLWLGSKGIVFALSREAIYNGSTLEAAKVKGLQFAGSYHNLAYGAGHLWGTDPVRRRICKIKLTNM